MSAESQQVAADRFPSTNWSEVAKAGQLDGEQRRNALEAMLGRYLPAMRSHLQYCRRLPVDSCEDIVQAFVAEKILSRNLIASARQERGRFRAFLTVTLDRFALNYLRSERARSRRVQESEDLEAFAPAATATPSVAFDVAWARGLLSDTLAQMERECVAKDRRHVWEIFQARTLLPVLENREPLSYQAVVEKLGFLSPSQAANALVTANRMFARILRGIIATYAESEQEVEEEIRQLHEILSSAGAGNAGSAG